MHLCRCLMAMFLAFAPTMVVVSGKLIDREGKPMQKAVVLYINTETGRTLKTQTNKKGEFAFAAVAPGLYEITATDANGQQVYSGKRYVRLVNENLIMDANATGNFLLVDLSTVLPATKSSGNDQNNLGQGKLSKEQLEAVRMENANIAEINRLILDLHTALDGHEWQRATEMLTTLIRLAPNRWEFYQNLGTVQTNLDHDQDAVLTFQKGVEAIEKAMAAREKDPAYLRAELSGMLLYQGDAYNRLGKTDEAMAAYKRAASISANPAMAWFRACSAQRGNGNSAVAIELCNQAIQSDPAQWEFYQVLGGIQAATDRPQEALDTYEKGIAVARKTLAAQPDSMRAKNGSGQMLNSLGNLQVQLKHVDQAIEAFNQSAEQAAYPAMPLFNLCATFYNLNRMTEAVSACDRAIASDPKMEDAYYIKAAALFGSGRLAQGKLVAPPETRVAINKYLELAPQGLHAADARGLLEKLDSEVETTYQPKAGPVKKK